MAQFDPYRKWLGIPPKEQPPNLYRLLGVGVFESDPDVISNAADRQMAHVRQFQGGDYSALSQQLLNELAAARVCLLDPARKSLYDNQLRQAMAGTMAAPPSAPPPPVSGPPPPPPPSPPPAVVAPDIASPGYGGLPARRRPSSLAGPIAVLAGLLVLIGIVGLAMLRDDDRPPSRPAAQSEGPKPVAHGNGNGQSPKKPPSEGSPAVPPHTPGSEIAAPPMPPEGRDRPKRRKGDQALPDRVGPLANLTGHRGAATSASFDPDGDFVLSGGEDGSVRLWDISSSADLRHFEGGVNPVLCVDFARDGSRVLATSGKTNPPAAGLLQIWNAAGGRPSQVVELSGLGVAWDARLSPDGKRVALACQDQTVRLLDAQSVAELRVFAGHSGPVRCVAFSEQNDKLASGSDDQTLRIWNAEDEKQSHAIQGHQGAMLAVAFSPDGTLVVSGSADKTARVWNVATGQRVHEWFHPDAVTSAAFAADGLSVLTGSLDGSIRLRRLADDTEIQQFVAHQDGVRSARFLPGGSRHVVTAGGDGTVRVWGFPAATASKTVASGGGANETAPKDPPAQRAAVPDEAAQQQAERLITEDVFKADFAAAEKSSAEKPAAKAALAQKLLEEGARPQPNNAAPFVLFRLARDTATEVGEVDAAMAAIDELNKRYVIDGPDMKAASLEAMAVGHMPVARRRTVAAKALQAADEAVADDRFETAVRLAKLAHKAATEARDHALARQTITRLGEVEVLKQKYQPIEAAVEAVSKTPDDVEANLTLGRYYCFVKGDWTKGLPRLAASSDEALKKQSQLDLANPLPPAERMAVGDGWWDLAEKQSGETRDRLRQRAAHWYRPLESTLVGIDQTKIKQRLAELGGAPAEATTPSTVGPKGRDAAARAAMLAAYGGNEGSEAAVEKALDWLARHQNPDGSWSFNHVRPACKEQCPDPGSLDAPNAATALALWPFLAAGHSYRADYKGKHRNVVANGLKFLGANLARGGQLFEPNREQMPSHALATIVICEASEGGRDKTSRQAALTAAEWILNRQNPDGGWGFTPRLPPAAVGDPSDVNATAWNVYALKAAQWGGVVDPGRAFARAAAFLDASAEPGGFRLAPDAKSSDVYASANGVLARIYLGWPREQQQLTDYVARLAKAGPSANGRFYLNFLQGQVMREGGGPAWPAWNTALRDHLINTQQTEGHAAGSWSSTNREWGNRAGGRLFCTAMAALTLEVYYRTPPVYP